MEHFCAYGELNIIVYYKCMWHFWVSLLGSGMCRIFGETGEWSILGVKGACNIYANAWNISEHHRFVGNQLS